MDRRIAIFGGTFNPPHMGHVSAARACVESLKLDRLIMIPTNIPPHKTLPEGSPTAAQRLEMTAIAASMVPMAEVSDMEICRRGASYSYETATQMAELYPDATLWFVMGTDMLASFENWRRPEVILSHCRIAAVARGKEDGEFIARQAKKLKRDLNAQVDMVYNHVIEGSSTDFRSGAAERLVPSEIRRYIRRKGLYGGIEGER